MLLDRESFLFYQQFNARDVENSKWRIGHHVTTALSVLGSKFVAIVADVTHFPFETFVVSASPPALTWCVLMRESNQFCCCFAFLEYVAVFSSTGNGFVCTSHFVSSVIVASAIFTRPLNCLNLEKWVCRFKRFTRVDFFSAATG